MRIKIFVAIIYVFFGVETAVSATASDITGNSPSGPNTTLSSQFSPTYSPTFLGGDGTGIFQGEDGTEIFQGGANTSESLGGIPLDQGTIGNDPKNLRSDGGITRPAPAGPGTTVPAPAGPGATGPAPGEPGAISPTQWSPGQPSAYRPRKSIFDLNNTAVYYHYDSPRDAVDLFLLLIKNSPAVIFGIVMILPTVFGLTYLISCLSSGISKEPGLPRLPDFFRFEDERATWLNVVNNQYSRLSNEAAALFRRIRILFGLGLICFSVSAALVVLLIEANLNNELDAIAKTIAYVSPVILFQIISALLLRQSMSNQKELSGLRKEMNDLQLLISTGLAAGASEEAFAKFVESMVTSKGAGDSKDREDNSINRPSAEDVRTFASLMAAFSRMSS